ncbi:SLC13 family permease [Oligoflexus tunisiensis]|uniref:SLC13 family permease n=1 Tax=Oligoflexus tunisiensis TaxID=708132 RepID=UPI000B224808|nr:SLC13 family permease [Oligoflexus tunisiensis]
MNIELGLILGLLVIAIALFILNRPRMDVVGVMALVALPLTGVLTVSETLSGLSDPNVVLIAALFVVGDGLVRTGVAHKVGDWLLTQAGTSESKLIILLMSAVALLGSTMSSTGVVAIFIPVVLRIAYRTHIAPSRLMMPLSFAGLISGMLTLVGTAPNLVVNGELVRSGFPGFSFFSFTPLGVPILVLGIGYMLFARRWLPQQNQEKNSKRPPITLLDFINKYHLHERLFQMRILPHSPWIGHSLVDLKLRTSQRISVLAFEKMQTKNRKTLSLDQSAPLAAGDILLIEFLDKDMDREETCQRFHLEKLPFTGAYFSQHAQDIGMAELLLPPGSELVGQTIVEAAFRSRYEITVVGIRRNLGAFSHGLVDEKLEPGDCLLVVGPWKTIKALGADRQDYVVLNLPAELSDYTPVARKAPHAIACVLVMVALMISGVVPNVLAAFIACLAMGAFGCINVESAYRSIHWPSLLLISGMMPFAIALQKTGGVDLAASSLVTLVERGSLHIPLALLFIATVLVGLFVSNTATAVLMAPMAISMAQKFDASPYPFAMIVALAASTAFNTPVSSPVNTLVVEPGRYRFHDFVRLGAPFSFLIMIISVILVPLFFPFS